MFPRQATRLLLTFPLLLGLWACSPSFETASKPGAPLPTFPSTSTLDTPHLAPDTPTPTATRLPPLPTLPVITVAPSDDCLRRPGNLVNGEVATPERPIAFVAYLPPCYEESPDRRYPVLYLLHGQTFTADQWVRLGAPQAADELIHSGQAAPFIMVFPEDRYWNLQQGLRFGGYLLNEVIPYIDANFHTLPDRDHRALGGLSRGGGWAFQIGLTNPGLFGSLGLHSPAVFTGDRLAFERWMRGLPSDLWPRLYLDVGDNDGEREFNTRLEELLTRYEIPHEWHLNAGAHDETYWSAHVEEYIRWYAEGWNKP